MNGLDRANGSSLKKTKEALHTSKCKSVSDRSLVKGLFVPLVFLFLWFAGSGMGLWNDYLIPSPEKVMGAAVQMLRSGELLRHTGASLFRIVAGFCVSVILAFPLGVTLGLSSPLTAYLYSSLEFVRHIPPLAIMPMLILWFGIGETSKIAVIVLATFFPIFLNTLDGVRQCDEKLIEVGRTLGLTGWEIFRKIIFPAALPSILMGMRLGLGYSWRALIGAELIAASSGIGYMIHDAEMLSRSDVIVVGVLTMGIIGALIDHFFFRFTSCLMPWRRSEAECRGWD